MIERGLWITLLAAVLTRLIHWINIHAFDPLYAQTQPMSDMRTYWVWAKAIAAGDWLSENAQNGPFYYGPLYAYFLACLFRVFGESYSVVHGLQALIGLLAPLVLWTISRRLFGKGPALATGLLAAFCAPILFYEQTLLTEGLLIAVHAAILVCLVRGQESVGRAWLWALGGGVLSGVACWGRGNFFLVIPAITATWTIAPVVFTRTLPLESPSGEPQSLRLPTAQQKPLWAVGTVCAAAYLLGVALSLSVTLWRNHHVADRWVLTTANGPILLYMGNSSDSIGLFQSPSSRHDLEKQYGSQGAVPWGRELLRDMAAHPGAFVRLLLKKTWMFWNSYDAADNVSYYACKRYSALMRWSPVSWLTLAPMALLGIWQTRRLWRRQIFLYVYTVGFALSIIAVFIVGRYRLEALFPMLVWAGPAAADLSRQAWERRWRRLVVPVLALAVGVAILWPTRSPAAIYNAAKGQKDIPLVRRNDYDRLAVAHLELGQRRQATELLEEAVAFYPWFNPLVRRLAIIHIQERKFEQAVAVLEKYIQLAGPDGETNLLLADALASGGRTADAIALLQDLLRNNPQDAQAQTLLSQIQKGGK